MISAMQDLALVRVEENVDAKILIELGSGPGETALAYAEVNPDIRILGLESATDGIRRATQAATESPHSDRIVFNRSDLSSLPLSDQSGDFLVGLATLLKASSPHVLLAESFRVLAPGGTAIFCEDVPEGGESTARVDSLGMPLSRGGFDEARLRTLIKRSPFRTGFTFSRHEFQGGTFLEITLTRPAPPEREGSSWRLGGDTGDIRRR